MKPNRTEGRRPEVGYFIKIDEELNFLRLSAAGSVFPQKMTPPPAKQENPQNEDKCSCK